MSKHTHIKWDGRGRGKRKWDGQPWGMDSKAVRTICDRSDRNYKPREHGDREEFEKRSKITDKRITHKEGLFRNAKESSLVINNLSPTMRRNIQNQVAGIVAPNESVEFVRPSLDQVWRNTQHGNRNYDRRDMDMRDQFTQPRHRYSQDDNARSRRRDYDDRRSPRKYDEFRQPNNHRERRDYRGQSQEIRRDNYYEHHHRDDHRRRGSSVHHVYDNRRSRIDFYDRNEKLRKPFDYFSTHEREKSYRRSAAPSPQRPSMFASGYKPVIMARRIVEESPLSSSGGSYSALRNCEKFNNYVDNFKSPNVPSPMALPTAVYQPSPVPEEDPEISYPSQRVAERILVAVPKIPLKDDSNERYGATARDLLKTSIKTLLSSNNRDQAPLKDLLNRTTCLQYNTFTQDERFGDLATENLFQPDQPSCIQEMYNMSPPPTPEREKQFNKTLIEELHIGDSESDDVETSAPTSQRTLAPVEINGNIWEDNDWINNAAVSSPGDISFFRGLEQLSNPVPQELNFDPSSLFE